MSSSALVQQDTIEASLVRLVEHYGQKERFSEAARPILDDQTPTESLVERTIAILIKKITDMLLAKLEEDERHHLTLKDKMANFALANDYRNDETRKDKPGDYFEYYFSNDKLVAEIGRAHV